MRSLKFIISYKPAHLIKIPSLLLILLLPVFLETLAYTTLLRFHHTMNVHALYLTVVAQFHNVKDIMPVINDQDKAIAQQYGITFYKKGEKNQWHIGL